MSIQLHRHMISYKLNHNLLSYGRLNINISHEILLQLLCGLAVIVIVLFQSGKSAGLSGAIGGVADSFLSRNKAKTLDAKLARATKWVGAIFLILTLVLLILQG